jgi:eukaryotic-like serine/threonine-protein kinase
MGSAPYMAPEQVEGKKVGPAVDVYGLGAILYSILCRRPPHRGANDADTLRRVVSEEIVAPRRFRADTGRSRGRRVEFITVAATRQFHSPPWHSGLTR